MSRRSINRSTQAQKLKMCKQVSIASKGVNYCKKCERRRSKKRKRITNPVLDIPPLSLFYFWLSICMCFYHPDIADWLFGWIRMFSKYSILSCLLIDTFGFLFVNCKRLARPTLDPQMGFNKIDPFLKESIQVWCLFECLKDSKSKRGMVAAITQYLQAHVKQSLPLYLYNQIMRIDFISDWSSSDGQLMIEQMIEEAFGTGSMLNNGGDIPILDTQDGCAESTTWHSAMDSAFSNWKEFRNSSIASRFTHLINIIVSAGMCSTADLSFKIGNVTLFSPIVTKKQLAAGDVFEAFYEAVSGFMKGGWRVFQTGEVSAFFMEDDKVSEFDKMYNDLRSWHGYAIAGNLREYTEIDDNEYESRLKKAIEFGENLLKFIKRSQTFERKYVADRMDRLRENETEFTQLRIRGGLRVAPFAVCLFGQSGCGKSSLTNLTVNAGLLHNDLSADKDRIAIWADNDKFASSVRSHINAIIFDDFANTKEDFMDFSPAYRLIQVINNIRYLAPMADVFLKGKVSLNPYFCIVSTNVEHLNAAKYSNEPESVLRRMYHVKVKPKEDYCVGGILSKRKIEAYFGRTSCPDVWDLTVRTYVAQNKRHVDPKAFVPVEFEGKVMENVSVKEYLRWVQIESKRHFEEERQYLENQDKAPNKCPNCSMLYCDCDEYKPSITSSDCMHESDLAKTLHALNHPSEVSYDADCSVDSISSLTGFDDVDPPILSPESGMMYFSGCTLKHYDLKAKLIQGYYKRALTPVVLAADAVCAWWDRFDLLPERFICHPKILNFCLIFWHEDIKRSIITGNCFIVSMMLVFMYGLPRFSLLWLLLATVLIYWYMCATVQTYRLMIRDRILDLKDVVQTYTQSWQCKYAIIGLGAIAVILATLRSKYITLDSQTGLDPNSMDEIQQRNDQVNPWLVAETVPLPMSEPAKTTTSENLASSMRTNLIGVVSDKQKTTLGFYIASNFIIVPTHFLKEHGERDINVRCYKTGENKVGSYFKDKLSQSFRVDIPSTDFSICYVTSGGSMKDFRKFLPEHNRLRSTPAKLVTREIMDTSMRAIPTLFKGSSRVAHTQTVFMGSYYDLPVETKSGMCMSPVISDARGSVILGFHLGGKGRLGGCGTLTLDQVNLAIAELSTIDGVVLSASCGDLYPHMGDFPSNTFGKPIFEGNDIHPKSAVNFLTEGACIDVYGKTSGKATPYSNVCPTLISGAVEEVFGVPQKWGPPKMKGKGRYPYQATLVHAAVPSLPIGSVLAKSVSAIKQLTVGLKAKIPELFHTKPLSRVATVCGLIGVKFIDPMNFSSSPGFPLSGSKHPLLIDLDPKDYPEIGKPRTFVPEVWAEFEKVYNVLKEGKRCYMIWKSCLKDEATKLTKDKVRVFQSAPLVLQLLIRMYFLPIVRIIQMNPILYECAVGVNAEGLEWEELWDAAMSKGRNRVLAGDYSKYDVRMPAQVTIAAFDILIDIAQHCDGYTEEDLHIMRMLVHEVTYPVMAYNGDLIQLFGTNPSGQNLTVIINSLVNSLLLRSCFLSLYPEGDFKEGCAFLTYGDDVIGTVSEKYDKFTHITYAKWLSEHDMKFTMPDKESTPTHYMSEDDVDFLKRKCVFNKDLGQKVGLLAEDSIFKRLHSHLLSKELTLPMHSAQNIESSLHDWFYYGRDVFEDRRSKLVEVAQKCDIEHLCPSLSVSYDKRVNHWRHKYLGEELAEEVDDQVLDCQCGDMYVGTYDYLDHCIGTGRVHMYWWEYWMPYVGWIWPFYVCRAVAQGRNIRFGHFDKRWLPFVMFAWNGFQFPFWMIFRVAKEILMIYFLAYYTLLIYRCYTYKEPPRVRPIHTLSCAWIDVASLETASPVARSGN